MIVGICLMGFGALALTVLLAVDKIILALLLSLPALACGLICLVVKWHPLLLCLWVVCITAGLCSYVGQWMPYPLFPWAEEAWGIVVMFFIGLVIATTFAIADSGDR